MQKEVIEPDMKDTLRVSFAVTPDTKEMLDRLYQELNRPVTHNKLLTLLLQTYYRKTAETALLRELEIVADRLGNEVVHKFDHAYNDSPQVGVSGQPRFTRSGVWYSPVEPRVSQ